jgi:hypothetical protein
MDNRGSGAILDLAEIQSKLECRATRSPTPAPSSAILISWPRACFRAVGLARLRSPFEARKGIRRLRPLFGSSFLPAVEITPSPPEAISPAQTPQVARATNAKKSSLDILNPLA